MDLDFSDEQQMLREMVRGVCADSRRSTWCASWRTTRSAIPTGFWKQLGELDLIGLTLPGRVRRLGDDAARGRHRSTRSWAGRSPRRPTSPARSLERGRAGGGRAPRSRSSAWLPAIASGEAILTPAWLEPENGFGPEGVQATRRGRRRRRSCSTGRSATCRSPRRPTRLVVLARTATDGRRPVPGRPDRARRVARAAAHHRVRHPVRGDLRRRRACPPTTASARPGTRLGHVDDGDGRRRRPARRPGRRRRAVRARDHRAVRQGPRAVRQAARRLPGAGPLPGRRRDQRRRGRRCSSTRRPGPAPTGGRSTALAPMAKLFACQTFRDVTAMAQQIFGGVGLHDRVRHPAVLPPGQAAPDQLVRRPLASKSSSPAKLD